ncbi:MAG: hypothetical protein RL235_617 [Chlamydiota bacterium]|jgi:hypothetical protein
MTIEVLPTTASDLDRLNELEYGPEYGKDPVDETALRANEAATRVFFDHEGLDRAWPSKYHPLTPDRTDVLTDRPYVSDLQEALGPELGLTEDDISDAIGSNERLTDAAIDELVSSNSVADRNYIRIIHALVDRMIAQFGEMKQSQTEKFNELTKQYKELVAQGAGHQKRLGNAQPLITAFGVALMLSQFKINSDPMKNTVKYLAEQVPSVGNLFTSRIQAAMTTAQSLATLLNTEISGKMSEQQSDAGSRQEVIEFLRNALNTLVQASRAS